MVRVKRDLNELILLVASFVVLFFGLWFIKNLVVPLLLCYIILATTNPLRLYLKKKLNLSRRVFICIFLLAVGTLLYVMTLLLSFSVDQTIKEYDAYYLQTKELANQLLRAINYDSIKDKYAEALREELISPATGIVKTFSMLVVDSLQHFVVALIFFIFMTLDTSIQKFIHRYDELKSLSHKVGQYVLVKSLISLLTAILVLIFMTVFNLKFKMLITILTFILNFIPSIGSIIATLILIPSVSLGANSFTQGFLLLLLPSSVQFLIGNILEPKLLGESSGLGPFLVIASLIFWSLLFGIWGLFLAVPLTLISISSFKLLYAMETKTS